MSGRRRSYSPSELAAFKSVSHREWNEPFEARGEGSGPPFYAGGSGWPNELRRKAAEFERLAPRYRLAADAMEREIAAETAHDEQAAVAATEGSEL